MFAIVTADTDNLRGGNGGQGLRIVERQWLKRIGRRIDEIAGRTFLKRRNQALDPEPATAIDDFSVLRSVPGEQAAVFHWNYLLSLILIGDLPARRLPVG